MLTCVESDPDTDDPATLNAEVAAALIDGGR